eukprot:110703-Pyramimonas_sp.AAC.1
MAEKRLPRQCPCGARAMRVWITAGPGDEGAAWCARCIGQGPHSSALWQLLYPDSLPVTLRGLAETYAHAQGSLRAPPERAPTGSARSAGLGGHRQSMCGTGALRPPWPGTPRGA